MITITVSTELGSREIQVERHLEKALLDASPDPEAIAIAEFLLAWRTAQLEIESYKCELALGAKQDV